MFTDQCNYGCAAITPNAYCGGMMTTETDTLLPVNKDLFVEFKRAYAHARYIKNKERHQRRCRERYLLHREEVIQKSAEWAEANPERRREIQKKWKEANPDEWKRAMIRSARKQRAKRKGMGFEPLNTPFDGSCGHHVNNDQVIYIPEELHRSVYHEVASGRGMAEINALAFQYLFNHT